MPLPSEPHYDPFSDRWYITDPQTGRSMWLGDLGVVKPTRRRLRRGYCVAALVFVAVIAYVVAVLLGF